MRILVYDGSPDYGGHQVMACHGIEALVADPAHEVVCMFNPANRKLALRLPQQGGLEILPTPCCTHKFQGLFNHFEKPQIRALAHQFTNLKVDLILCIQGDIEGSSQALLAAKVAGIPSVSYLALPHGRKQMKAKLGRLRDQTNRYLFSLPDRFIAISNSMQQLLKQQGATAPIQVVHNGIPAPRPAPRTETTKLRLGLIGRIEFNQKQQDFMVNTFCAYPEAFSDCQLRITGSGPDQDNLTKQIMQCSRSTDIEILPWQDDMNRAYAEIDVLMLPSRFEGVPLVMLEALARGIPVFASRCDGMQDVLPDAWTFEPGNAEAFAQTFAAARDSWPQHIDALKHRVETEMSLAAFKTNFSRAVIGA